jgi:hypothetical protein
MAGPHFFAWCDEADVFGPDLAREDEDIFAIALGNAEGNFGSLSVDIINRRIGYLGPGLHQWCWYSWFDGTSIVPLFHGRLLALPDNTQGETVRLMFVAKPSDYLEQKAALAATLRELPWHDPVFQEQQAVDDDAVLETRVGHWHIDPVSLEVSLSNDMPGEDDEIIEVTADDHFYSVADLTYSATPKRRVKVKASGSYNQRVELAEVNLTPMLVKAFREAGSVFDYPLIGSFTSDGLLGDWPKPGDSLGGGWSMSPASFAIPATYAGTPTYSVRYTDKSDSTSVIGSDHRDNFGNILPGFMAHEFFIGWINYDVTFSVAPILVNFIVMCDAARKRNEEITFTMNANVQSVMTDPGDTEEEEITLTTSLIDQPVDAGGVLPIGDPRRNCYFVTDRGGLSVQFLMLLAAATLLRGSRVAQVKFRTTWEFMAGRIATNKSVHLVNPHLPGGQCLGKIISFQLTGGRGGNVCDVTIACSVGYSLALPTAAEGENTWADDWADDWTETEGAEITVIPGQLLYGALDGTVVIDDDGVDLFNLTPETIVTELTIVNGANDQYNAINGSLLARHDNTRVSTTGDVLGTAVTNLKDPTGLVSGVVYDVMGVSTISLHGPGGSKTTFTFDGTNGGTLSQPGPSSAIGGGGPIAVKGASLTFSRPSGSVFTPDPIAALKDTATKVRLKLLSSDGGDFLTQFDIPVEPLMVPKTIDLEAPSQ